MREIESEHTTAIATSSLQQYRTTVDEIMCESLYRRHQMTISLSFFSIKFLEMIRWPLGHGLEKCDGQIAITCHENKERERKIAVEKRSMEGN